MKLYLFDTESGLYLGQDFGAQSDINHCEGITELPPPDFTNGETPVFDSNKNQWTVVEIDRVRPMIIQKRQESHEV